MTVATEASYHQLQWTGVETSFTPGFSAEAVADVQVSYLDINQLPVALTRGVHFSVSLGADGAVTVTPIAFPSASAGSPVTIIIQRNTTAVQGVDFENLNSYDPSVYETLFDRAFRILGELKGKIARAVTPFVTTDSFVDFRPYRVKAADPVDDADLATKAWVLLTTGILNLNALVAAAAASAAAAAASAASALGYQTGAQTARDKAQAWSDTAEDTFVPGTTEYSAFNWYRKALAQAQIATGYANTLTTAIHDWGNFQGATTVAADWGDFH